MIWRKSRLTPSEKKQLEQLHLQERIQKSQINYIAMMTDVEIPGEDDNNEEQEV